MEKLVRVYRACLIISFAQQHAGTNLIAGFDHQAISDIYCGCFFLHKLPRKLATHGNNLLRLASKILAGVCL